MKQDRSQTRWLIAGGAALLTLVVADVAHRMAQAAFLPTPLVDDDLRGILRLVLVVIAAINLILPYVWGNRLHQSNTARLRLPLSPELEPVVFGVFYSMCPVLYAVLLFVFGDPALHVLYGALVTILALVVWTIYSGRKAAVQP